MTAPIMPDKSSSSAGAGERSKEHLEAGAIGLLGVLMQNITAIGPGFSGLFTVAFIVSYAGAGAPLAYLIGFLITLLLGYVLMEYTKHLSSAGTYYTFTTRALGGRAGFMVGWMYLLFYPITAGTIAAFMGITLQQSVQAAYNVTIEWWWIVLAFLAILAVTAVRGIKLSITLLIVLGIIESVIVVALGAWGFARPGQGGVSLGWLSGGSGTTLHGLFLGVVFAIFATAGWDAAAPLAEESKNPRKIIPLSVIGSILIMGVFLVFMSWGQTTGWGTQKLTSLVTSAQLPAFTLGHRYWGAAWILILIALLNSSIAVAIACTNASTRIFYGMGRTGALPRILATISRTRRTPTAAVALELVITAIVGLGIGAWLGPVNLFNVTGVWYALILALVYGTANVGIFVFYRREHRDEFRVLRHVVIPVAGLVALAAVVYYSLTPFPTWPISLAPWIVVGWLILGSIILAIIYRGRRAAELDSAGEVMAAVMTKEDFTA